MTTFDERKRAFEAKFTHDSEMRFKLEARRNKLLALWVAEQMGKSAQEAEDYVAEVIASDFEEAGSEDVVRKIAGDTIGKLDADTIRAKLAEMEALAKKQMLGEEG